MSVAWKQIAGPAVITGTPSSLGTPISAVIATLAEVDLDGDTYQPGAFRYSGTQLISQWAHNSIDFALPVGSGVIEETGGKAIFQGMLWTEMVAAQDVAAMLRRRGSSQEWSYAYKILDAAPVLRAGREVQQLRAVDAYEVSPVLRGAGVRTATLRVGDAGKVLAEARRHIADHQAAEELRRAELRLIALSAAIDELQELTR